MKEWNKGIPFYYEFPISPLSIDGIGGFVIFKERIVVLDG